MAYIAIWLIGISALLLGGYFLEQAIAKLVYGWVSEKWPTVTGTVKSVDLRAARGRAYTEYWLDIRYAYTVEGQTYCGKRNSLHECKEAPRALKPGPKPNATSRATRSGDRSMCTTLDGSRTCASLSPEWISAV